MITALPHTGERPGEERRSAARAGRVLVMGPNARAIAGALVRMKGTAEIHHAETAAEAVSLLQGYRFDRVLVDNLSDGALALTIPRLATLENVGSLIVLAGPKSAETISAIPGVGLVLQPPFNPVEIAGAMGIEITDSRKGESKPVAGGKRAGDAEPTTSLQQHETLSANEPDGEREGEAPALIRFARSIALFIPGLTPVLSLLYKNLALTILAGLFAAFISYGIMIAFFLVSGDWSAPMQLQPGHELVSKADRDMKELQVKRNLAIRQLADARNSLSESKQDLERANLLATSTIGTIEQEIENRKTFLASANSEIDALRSVLKGFGSAEERRRQRANTERDFQNRIITRNTYQDLLLNAAQVERQVAEIQVDINQKIKERNDGQQAIAILNAMMQQARGEQGVGTIGGRAEFVPLTNQIIEVRQTRSRAQNGIRVAEEIIPSLEDSLAVLDRGIADLEKTPMIRALEKPINVLFVPYDNLNSYEKGRPLYSCGFAVFWCSKAGTTGEPISGEITTVHPFFGKPIRGQFIEAELDNNETSQKEILHVGRPPFFF